jgi:hypothetical protein
MSWGTYDPHGAGPKEHAEAFRKHKKKLLIALCIITPLLVWWGEYGFGV